MSKIFYTVHAFRLGDREMHSYIVGVYSGKQLAKNAAKAEEEYRGGKYECEILEWEADKGIEGDSQASPKYIKRLTGRPYTPSLPEPPEVE